MLRLVKSTLRPLYHLYVRERRNFALKRNDLQQTHEYWKNPTDADNDPTDYSSQLLERRSEELLQLFRVYAPDTASRVLEVGCNAGRNLNYLHRHGYRNVSGIEISPAAVETLKRVYPALTAHATIYNIPVEEQIRKFSDGQFDVVFTMAVMEHIHPDSDWVFKEMARVTSKVLIAIENEQDVSERTWRRNYRKVFEALGMQQVFEKNKLAELPAEFVARVFVKSPSLK